jgi:hypothetical protein
VQREGGPAMSENWPAGCKARPNGVVAVIRLTSHTWAISGLITSPNVEGGHGPGEVGRLGGRVPREAEAGLVGRQ